MSRLIAAAVIWLTGFYFCTEQNCLDVSRDFANPVIIDLVKQKMDSLPKPKDKAKGKEAEAKKPKATKAKVHEKSTT